MAEIPSRDRESPAEKAGNGGRQGCWQSLTPWTVLGLAVTAACVGVLAWIQRSDAVPDMDKLLADAGALIVYVIVMASGARVAYKRCQRE